MSNTAVAFGLRADLEGEVEQVITDPDTGEEQERRTVPRYLGGVIGVGLDSSIDLREALDNGGGVIVVDERDDGLINALDEQPALKRVKVPDNAAVLRRYHLENVDGLRAEAARRGIEGHSSAGRERLLTALLAQDDALAEGDLQAANAVRVEAASPSAPETPSSTAPPAGAPATEAQGPAPTDNPDVPAARRGRTA